MTCRTASAATGRAVGLALSLAAAACTGSSSTDGGAPAVDAPGLGSGVVLTNFELAVAVTLRDGDRFAVTVPEASQATTDLNDDGDVDDEVYFLVDPAAGEVTSTGGAARRVPWWTLTRPRYAGGRVVVPVGEAEQGSRDLNKDGDAEDQVLEVFDPATGETETIEYATWAYGDQGVVVTDDAVCFSVWESEQGDRDLNDDGDTDDWIVHVVDLESFDVAKLPGSHGSHPRASATRFAFVVQEDEIIGDLNGDGDTTDPGILHLHDARTGAFSNTGLSVQDFLSVGNDEWLVLVQEEFQGDDFNGDADTDDLVLFSYDARTAQAHNREVATYWLSAVSPAGDYLPELVGEDASDLNGDGDRDDIVLHARHLPSGMLVNSGLATLNAYPPHALWVGGWLAMLVDEARQGDLNGDGVLDASVPHAFHPGTGAVVNLVHDAFDLRTDGRFLYFMRDELGTDTDWNGDGDALDLVPFWWDSQTMTTRHFRRGTWSPLDLHAGVLLTGVFEGDEAEDLNGDGDLGDVVTFAIELATGAVANTGLVTGQGTVVDSRSALLQVPEYLDHVDLNGDGDAYDQVLFRADLFR